MGTRHALRGTKYAMGSDRRLYLSLLVLGLLMHAAALTSTWVELWTETYSVVPLSGWDVLVGSVETGSSWRALPGLHLLSACTLLIAWRMPSNRIARGLGLVLLLVPTVAIVWPLGVAGLWNGTDAWPEGAVVHVLRALAPGSWWVRHGVLTWGIAQAMYAGVLMLRAREAAQRQRQARWAARPQALDADQPLHSERLGLLAPNLRGLVLEAHRLRVDLDAPVRPLDDGCRSQLIDLAVRMRHLPAADRECLRRAGAESSRLAANLVLGASPRQGWWTELRVVDQALANFVSAALSPAASVYR